MDPPPIEDSQDALDRLESLLARQVACAKDQDYPAVLALGSEVESALRQASALPPAPPELRARLQRVEALRRKLSLILAQHRHELAGCLGRLRRGKGTLRAYRANSTRI